VAKLGKKIKKSKVTHMWGTEKRGQNLAFKTAFWGAKQERGSSRVAVRRKMKTGGTFHKK